MSVLLGLSTLGLSVPLTGMYISLTRLHFLTSKGDTLKRNDVEPSKTDGVDVGDGFRRSLVFARNDDDIEEGQHVDIGDGFKREVDGGTSGHKVDIGDGFKREIANVRNDEATDEGQHVDVGDGFRRRDEN